MYRHLPYFDYIKKIIVSNSLGKLLKIESSFCAKIYKQKNFFGFKINKPNYLHRLFNKDLGGGSILDLGCYPISLVSFLNSITYNVDMKDIKVIKVDKEICESGVDICSNIALNFDDKFRSNIRCSFKDKPDQSTVIYFENGTININDTWTPRENMFIYLKQGKEKKKINFKINKNIYSHQILFKMAQARKDGSASGLEPDSKSQVTMLYENGKPTKVTSLVISSTRTDSWA